MNWFYAENGVQKGPVDEERFQALIADGTVRPDTLVWREGLSEWRTCGDVLGTGAAPPPVATAAAGTRETCAECGASFIRDDMVAYGEKFVCAGCRDVFFQKVREGVTDGAALVYAGFWIRFAAYVIDYIALFVVGQLIQLPLAFLFPITGFDPQNPVATGAFVLFLVVSMLLQTAVWVGYGAFFIGKFGATPGKMALSLKVVRPDGGPVSYARAAGRTLAHMLSGMILLIGYIMAAFDEEKRSLHDRICDTRVTRN